MKRLLSLAIALLASACASDDPECTIRPSGEAGIRLLECPSGTVRIVGGDEEGTCVITSEEDGWRRVSCSDGTSVLIDPEGRVHYPGSGDIRGMATLAGAESSYEGIVVRAIGTPFETRTEADGFFALDGLPAGLYDLLFEYPGRVPERRVNIPVVNGTYVLEDILISTTLRLSEDIQAETIPSPSGDSLLVLEETDKGSLLTLIHLESWDRVHLSSNAYRPVYRFDGRQVLWTENLSSRSKLRTYEVDSGERGELPVEGLGATYLADGRTVLVWQRAEHKDRLLAYDTLEQASVELGPWSPSPFPQLPMGPDGGSVVFRASGELILWDKENQERVTLSSGISLLEDVHYHPSGRQVAVVRRAGSGMSLLLTDLARGTHDTLEPSLLRSPIHFSGDGSLLWEGEGGWKLWDGETGETRPLPLPPSGTSAPDATFLPDGSGILFTHFPAVHLLMRDESEARLLSANALEKPMVTSDSRFVIIKAIEDSLPRSRIVRTRDGSSLRLDEGDWKLGAPGWMYRLQGGELFAYEFEQEELVKFPSRVMGAEAFDPAEGTKLIVSGEETSTAGRQIGLWDWSSPDIHWVGEGDDPKLSKSGRYLFYRTCMGAEEGRPICGLLYRYDLETQAYDFVIEGASNQRDIFERVATFAVPREEEKGLYLVRTEP